MSSSRSQGMPPIGCVSLAWLRFSALSLNLTAWFSSRGLLPVTHLLYPSALIALLFSNQNVTVCQSTRGHKERTENPCHMLYNTQCFTGAVQVVVYLFTFFYFYSVVFWNALYICYLFNFFYFYPVFHWNGKIHSFFLITTKSGLLAGDSKRIFCVSFSRQDFVYIPFGCMIKFEFLAKFFSHPVEFSFVLLLLLLFLALSISLFPTFFLVFFQISSVHFFSFFPSFFFTFEAYSFAHFLLLNFSFSPSFFFSFFLFFMLSYVYLIVCFFFLDFFRIKPFPPRTGTRRTGLHHADKLCQHLLSPTPA